MLVSIARRLLSMLVTLFGVSVIIFVILRWLPGQRDDRAHLVSTPGC